MASADVPDPDADPYGPPAVPTEVRCLHCDQEYQSYLIEWVERIVDGQVKGSWRCPTPGCNGGGFGIDILPTDPDYVGEDGEPIWTFDDDEDDEYDDLVDLDELDELVDLDELARLAELDELTRKPDAEPGIDGSTPPADDGDAVDKDDAP